jgi:HEAT repeat protein
MTLVNHPGSWQQMALASIDAGIARDTALMLADVHAVLDGLTSPDAPAAAGQAAAILQDTGSPYDLRGLAGAVAETVSRLHQAISDALAGIPDHIPGS